MLKWNTCDSLHITARNCFPNNESYSGFIIWEAIYFGSQWRHYLHRSQHVRRACRLYCACAAWCTPAHDANKHSRSGKACCTLPSWRHDFNTFAISHQKPVTFTFTIVMLSYWCIISKVLILCHKAKKNVITSWHVAFSLLFNDTDFNTFTIVLQNYCHEYH